MYTLNSNRAMDGVSSIIRFVENITMMYLSCSCTLLKTHVYITMKYG